MSCECLIDDYDGLRTGGVSFIEESSFEHAEAEDPLHLWPDGTKLGDQLTPADIGGAVSRCIEAELHFERGGEWRGRHERGALHAGDVIGAVYQRLIELGGHVLSGESIGGDCHVGDDDMVGAESERYVAQSVDCSQQEPASD